MDRYEYQNESGLCECRRHEYNTGEFWYSYLSINDIMLIQRVRIGEMCIKIVSSSDRFFLAVFLAVFLSFPAVFLGYIKSDDRTLNGKRAILCKSNELKMAKRRYNAIETRPISYPDEFAKAIEEHDRLGITQVGKDC